MAFLRSKRSGLYASGFKFNGSINDCSKIYPSWVKFLFELGKTENQKYFNKLDTKDAFKLILVHRTLKLQHKLHNGSYSACTIEAGQWLVKFGAQETLYRVFKSDEELLEHYEILTEVPEKSVFEFTPNQLNVITELLDTKQYQSTKLVDSHGATAVEFDFRKENLCSQKEWIDLIEAFTVQQDINFCTPKIEDEEFCPDEELEEDEDEEDEPEDEPSPLAYPQLMDLKTVAKLDKIINFGATYGASKDKIESIVKANLGTAMNEAIEKLAQKQKAIPQIVCGRYVVKTGRKVVQAVQMSEACLHDDTELPEWCYELIDSRFEKGKPKLVFVFDPSDIPGHTELDKVVYKALKQEKVISLLQPAGRNPFPLKEGMWLVREVIRDTKMKGNIYHFFVYDDKDFKQLFEAEKTVKLEELKKAQNVPLPWSDPKWLPYTYLNKQSGKYVLSFVYGRTIANMPFEQMPGPMRRLMNGSSYPELDLVTSGGIYYGLLRHSKTRTSKVQFGTRLVLELDPQCEKIENISTIDNTLFHDNYKKVGS